MKLNASMRVCLLMPVLVLLFLGGCRGGSQVKFGRLDRWVKTGFQYLQSSLSRLQLSAVAVYVSEPNSDKVLAILPDSYPGGLPKPKQGAYGTRSVLEHSRRHQVLLEDSRRHQEDSRRPQEDSRRHQDLFPGTTAHDAVMVLDPSPGETFGHPVLLFYVDLNTTKKKCGHMDGIYLGEECLTLALKSRCQNQLKRRQSAPGGGGQHLGGNGRARRATVAAQGGGGRVERSGGLCEIHFLPLVVRVRDSNRTQRLRCVEHPDFARCPQPLPLTSPNLPVSSCELNKNTRRCHQQPLATHLACRLYQTCDHAVLLSGGWQEQITYQRHVQNLQLFYRMLRTNGFHKDHIKTFFAGNGQMPAEEAEGVYPATEKGAIRNHISYICRKQHCADSLVLYLNSPTRNDGTMLLWDGNYNGIADLKERYSVGELLADLAGCRARRVLLFVEQSYSGALSKRLRGSLKHLNVVLLNSPPWASLHPAQCLIDHLGQGAGMPRLLEPWAGLLNVTLAGAPCNATPPLTQEEMRKEYQGCQNLPTALWYQNHSRRSGRTLERKN